MTLNLLSGIIDAVRRSRETSVFERAQENFNRTLYNDLKYEAAAGHMVQSKGEKKLADRLWQLGIPYIYNQQIEVEDHWMRPDFVLPTQNNLIVEFAGMNTLEYNEKLARKAEIMTAAGVPFLILRPDDLNRLHEFFA